MNPLSSQKETKRTKSDAATNYPMRPFIAFFEERLYPFALSFG